MIDYDFSLHFPTWSHVIRAWSFIEIQMELDSSHRWSYKSILWNIEVSQNQKHTNLPYCSPLGGYCHTIYLQHRIVGSKHPVDSWNLFPYMENQGWLKPMKIIDVKRHAHFVWKLFYTCSMHLSFKLCL